MSRTNIDLDDKLVKEGLARMKCHTKKEASHLAFQELVSVSDGATSFNWPARYGGKVTLNLGVLTPDDPIDTTAWIDFLRGK